ncbi:MAG TPA: magnesium transporter [Ktedonobacteraceae bacterium]|nr:magnesium transporter [Ktedonobacteraceae bacterium]
MIFLSTLLRQGVYDSENQRVGTLRDVCVTLNETFPVVTALVVQKGTGSRQLYIPWSQIHTIEEDDHKVPLSVKQEQIAAYEPYENEILLRRDVLDKQIVDTQGFRVVKVNDLKLAQIKKTARLVGVDISLGGLLRRLGMQSTLDMVGRIVPLQIPERTITWNYVEPLQMVQASTTGSFAPVLAGAVAHAPGVIPQVQLNVSHNKLADLRPADIADILEQLDLDEAGAMLERLDTETAADTLNEVELPLQSELLSELDPERASDLLERLAPDDAADILAEMPEGEAERLLSLMPATESQPIRELLRYGSETAGGIMTPEVLALQQESSVADALLYLRQNSQHLEMVYYLYVIDEERHLKGVVSLRELVTAEPETLIRDLMDDQVIRVHTEIDQEEVAHIIAKYDLLGVPVVDQEERLVGLVTVDDVIDVIHEEQAEDFSEIAGTDVEEAEEEVSFSWRRTLTRSSWLTLNTAAGFLLALFVYEIGKPLLAQSTALALVGTSLLQASTSHLALAGVICLMPTVLLTTGSAGSQSLGIVGWQLRSKRGRDFWRGLFRELLQGTVGGILTTILVCLLSFGLFKSGPLALALGIGVGLALLIASLCGVALPKILQRLRLRGSLITAPLLDPVIAIISLVAFFAITLSLIESVGM